jgi:hypothetical protein
MNSLDGIAIRPLEPHDSIDELTALLHRGYRFIEYAQWRGKRYRSVIMSKTL